MKVSLSLLKNYLPTIKATPNELMERLSAHAFEVEGFEEVIPKFSGVITAQVLTVEKHPNADRLRVIRLTTGKKEIYPVVCGAWNFGEGDRVALALPGAVIPQNIHSDTHESFTLNKATIRGIESQGMICAAFELGLSADPEPGILIFGDDTELGADLLKLLGKDIVFDISLPANRPDLFSHMGIAREIASVFHLPWKEPKIPTLPKAMAAFPVSISSPACRRYIGMQFENVKIAPSPLWLSSALKSIGIRSINNVVDITNYVMTMVGEPLHAFDAAKIDGGIVVRNAKKGEKLTTIDHKERQLTSDMLLIADKKKALALAGIMGGVDSEISDSTTSIILEAANFDPITLRKASSALSLRTEGSIKWEKGLHPELAAFGARMAADLLVELAGATLVAASDVYPSKPKALPAIKTTVAAINKLLGTTLSAAQIKKALTGYGMKVAGSSTLSVTPPYFRTDVTTPPDLAEEVLKALGLSVVKPQVPSIASIADGGMSVSWRKLRAGKAYFACLGFSEVQTYSFISHKDIEQAGLSHADHFKIANPLSNDQGYLKRQLTIPLLKVLSSNLKTNATVRIFEFGKEYLSYEQEPLMLGAAMASTELAPQILFNEMKGAVESFLKHSGLSSFEFIAESSRSVIVKSGKTDIGFIRLLPGKLLKAYDIDAPVVEAELHAEQIFKQGSDLLFKPFSKYPKVVRDISLVLDQSISWQKIEAALASYKPLLVETELSEAGFLAKDKAAAAFHEKLVKEGKKNWVIRLVFQAQDKTLTDGEVSRQHDQIVVSLRKELKAEIR